MDTKEYTRPKRARASAGGKTPPEKGTNPRRRKPAPSRETSQRERRNPAPSGETRRKRPTSSADPRPKRQPNRQQPRKQQVIRPPREQVPPVQYTMPKPFSRGGFLLKLLSMVLAVVAVMMCLSLFFRVEEVVVSGTEKYTPWMIKQASGISDGDSLLGIRDSRVSGKIISQLPYVKNVRVGIKLPGTVYIAVEELEMTYAIAAQDGSWWLIAADGRVVESITTTAASGYTQIFGVQVDGPRENQIVQAAQDHTSTQTQPTQTEDPNGVTLPTTNQVTGEDRLEAVLTILAALEENGVIGQIASVDVSNLNDITMEYGQRLHIVLGTSENLPYKVRYMAQAISQLEEYETGELDVSFKYSDKGLLNPES